MINQLAHRRRAIKPAKHSWIAHDPATVPLVCQAALREAMAAERMDPTAFDDLLWIMAQESAGVVNAHNPESSARGLFQLLRDHYDLNPNGEGSFGNAVEECQGGIHYILGRYASAQEARQFWAAHHWY